MKTLHQYIKEKLIINKDYKDTKIVVKSVDELRKIIEDRYKKLGPGTEQNPIDFNDIDVSNLDSFSNDKDKGIFEKTDFKYIDISDWDVSNATNMSYMFYMCKELKSVGNISGWDVSNVTNMSSMFYGCTGLTNAPELPATTLSNFCYNSMFYGCESFNQDLSNWDVSNVKFKGHAFRYCPIKEEYKPKFK